MDLPPGKNVVGCKWIFKIKKNADGSFNRFKARLVAQGFSQEEGIDFHEVFAPVAKYNSIRTVLAVSNALDLELHQMDVKTAFLNGTLEEDIYMSQPQGCIEKDKPEKVCKLRKSLYGLKQSARCWNQEMDKFLNISGYKQSNADSCIYTKVVSNSEDRKSLIILALYVDDILIASSDNDMLQKEKQMLSQRYKMEDMGPDHHCLGVLIERNRDNKTLYVSQKAYLEDIITRFGMMDCKPVPTPIEPGRVYKRLSDDDTVFDKKKYQAAIGSLNYVMIATRPDICVAVGFLSQFMSNPSMDHWQGVKRIFRYLKGTSNHCLTFNATNADVKLHGYADADWAGDVETRKSTSGYIFQLAGSTISWRSQKQQAVALSTTEAEYISISSATQEAIWLRRLISSLGFDCKKATVLFEDNQGAIALSKNPKGHSRTKHIDIKYHFIREAVSKKEIELAHCPSEKMIADILTKGLPKQKI